VGGGVRARCWLDHVRPDKSQRRWAQSHPGRGRAGNLAGDAVATGLFEEIARFGEATVRRIYGDFSSTRLRSWSEILQRFAIDPYQQFAYTSGKNASDIALVIDAMDLLHSGRFDGFCLVSSDSDFTRLASRLREEGADVYGSVHRRPRRLPSGLENLLPERAASGGDALASNSPISLQTLIREPTATESSATW
jgi:hypothetical protein